MSNNSKKIPRVIIFTLPITIVIIALPVYFMGRGIYDWLNEKKFKSSYKSFHSYLDSYTNVDGFKKEVVDHGYIVGKVIVMDLSNSRFVDSLRRKLGIDSWNQINCREFRKLPVGLRASTPEEVGTIVWLIWGRERVGTYMEYRLLRGDRVGPSAYRITCEVVVINKAKTAILDRVKFSGDDPPEKISKPSESLMNFDEYGSRPTEQIVKYIKSLPIL
jgi:hypothetical protein